MCSTSLSPYHRRRLREDHDQSDRRHHHAGRRRIFGGLDFSSHFLLLGPGPAGLSRVVTDYAALKKAGAPVLGWGEFITEVVSFLILAFIIFLMVRWATKLMRKREEAAPQGRRRSSC